MVRSRRSIVGTLVLCNLRSIVRKNMNKNLFLFSSSFLFGLLFLMWCLTSGIDINFLSDEVVSKLSFDMICKPKDLTHSSLSSLSPHDATPTCQPYIPPEELNKKVHPISPTTILLHILDQKTDDSNRVDMKHFAKLLGSIMMNGLPLLGLDDFVHASDFVNRNLDTKTQQEIIQSPLLNGQFGNFLNVRNLQIRLSPTNCWTLAFVKHLKKTSAIINSKAVNIKVYKSMYQATKPSHCCSSVWMHIEIINKDGRCPVDHINSSTTEDMKLLSPSVTLRFHPASIPDSRNKMWSPRKHGGGTHTSLQAGQLLYFTSGFLSIQLEIQNFLSLSGLGHGIVSHVLSTSTLALAGIPMSAAPEAPLAELIAETIIAANSTAGLFQNLSNLSSVLAAPRPVLQVPLYDRAYPTRGYSLVFPSLLCHLTSSSSSLLLQQDMFWHKLSEMIAIMLIVYFSLPGALISSYFCQQSVNGQFDSLFSLPGVTISSCVNAWIVTCCFVVMLPIFFSSLFFSVVLKFTSWHIPILNLCLLGISFAPISIIVSLVVKRAETAVIVVPTIIFLGLLPGLLYYDLAYDVQRSPNVELFLCLLPPSAGLMIIKLLCSLEAYHTPLLWTSTAIVSNVPLYNYTLVLIFDFFLYYFIALFFAWSQFRIKDKLFLRSQNPTSSSDGPQQLSPFPPHHSFLTRNWLNLTKLGIPFRFQHFTATYSQIPDTDPVAVAAASVDLEGSLKGRDSGKNLIAVLVSSLCKSYETIEGSPIEVLRNVCGELTKGSITTLLGSNGAGKTTLLRILGGFDSDYTGCIRYNSQNSYRSGRRIVGWCPQSDPLFEYLTVLEHLQMFLSILSLANGNANHLFETNLLTILTRVNLTEHSHKQIHMLSGGMKRRLSLLLACLGDPCVLLLDEPTSGCDSFTRELVRKDIIGRKHSCAILISTHHIDDVEIISDKVWFLNEHSLIYNGPLVNLHDEQQQQGQSSYYQARPAPGTSALQSRSEFLSSFVEFSTSSHSVMENFLRIFPDQPPSSLTSSKFGTIHSWSISMNSHRNRATLHQFIESLESQGNSQWSIVSPNAYKSLSRMYDITETKYQLGDPLEETHGETPGAGHTSSWGNISWERILLPEWFISSQFGLACRRCYHLLKLRVLEVKSQSSQFLISQLLLPFFIVLFLVFACGDVRYPKLELQSASIGGIGEILIANGGYRNRSSVDLESVLVMESESLRMKELDHSLMTDATPAAAVCNDSLVWKGAKSSDELFTELSEEYFSHTSNRWASFVLDDTVDQWLQSRVRIPKGSLQLSFDQIMDTLSDLRATICQNFTTQQDPTATGSSREGSRGGNSGVSSMVSSHKIQFCSQLLSSIEFSVVNETMVPSSSHGSSNVTTSTVSGGEEGGVHEVFMITVYQSLHANLTMMTNISTDHSSPIFLKEIAPYIYSSFQSNPPSVPPSLPPHPPLASNSSSPSSSSASSGFLNTRKEIGTPSYSLSSHPFDDATDSSSTYIERGYLGALMIILYLLLVSSVSVKFITNNKSSGVKTQVHLCGVSPLLYWLSNFIADSLSLFLSYLCIFLAILFGGAPIRNFFFLDDSGSLFLLSLLVFSFASVASNYSLAVLSKDQISSQLLSLVSSICCGLFLKFFISLQETISPYPLISTLCTLLSPSYALTSCLFELFTRYVKQLGKSVGIIERDVVLDLNAIYFPISVMCAQTIAYLLLTILIDTHWYPLLCSLQSAWDSCSSSLYSSFSSSVLLRRTRSLSSNLHVSIRERLFQYIHLAASQDSPPPSFVPPLSSPSHSSLHTSPLPSPSIGRRLEKAIISSMTPPSSPQLQRHPAMSHGSSHALLSLQNLSVKYPLATTEALKSLNLELSSGERVALMGINGGGKSSLFKTLSTTETIPVSGSAILCHCHTVHDHWRLGQVSAVGYVPQEGGLLEYLTVREVLDFFGGLRSQNRDTHHPRHPPALALVGSTSGSTRGSSTSISILPKKYESYLIQSLSGGNKKKLSVVLSNLNSPAILLLDEPSSGVDPAAAERIVSYLSNLPRDQSILYASHRLDECLRICHRVLMLYGGRMQFDGNLTVLDSISDLFYQIDVQLLLLPPSVASSSSSRSFSSSSSPERAQQMIAMGDFLELLRQSFQKVLRGETQRQREGKGGQGGEEEGQKGEGDVLERAVVYNESLVRITLEKNRIPFSSAWTIFEQFSVEGLIQKYSFRKMDLEEIFAIILSTDSLPPPQSVATHLHREHEEEQR